MDRARLAELVRTERTVEHGRDSYRLVVARPEFIAEVQHELAKHPDDPAVGGVKAMVRAVQRCLLLDGEEAPSLTEPEAASVVALTGGLTSAVGRAAMEMCGVSLPGAGAEDEDPDELPTS